MAARSSLAGLDSAVTTRTAVNHTGNSRDGLEFTIGLDRKGRVVHYYPDGTHVTILGPKDRKRQFNRAPRPLPPEGHPNHALLQEVARQLLAPGTYSSVTSRSGMKGRPPLPTFRPR
jgi:hypothetical protein